MSTTTKNGATPNGQATATEAKKTAARATSNNRLNNKEKELQEQVKALEKKLDAERKKEGGASNDKPLNVEQAIERGKQLQAVADLLEKLKQKLSLLRSLKLNMGTENLSVTLKSGSNTFSTSNQAVFAECVNDIEQRLTAAIKKAEADILALC